MSIDAKAAVLCGVPTENLQEQLDGGALVDGAILLVRLRGECGTSLHVAYSDGLDWITRRGMLDVASEMETIDTREGDDE